MNNILWSNWRIFPLYIFVKLYCFCTCCIEIWTPKHAQRVTRAKINTFIASTRLQTSESYKTEWAFSNTNKLRWKWQANVHSAYLIIRLEHIRITVFRCKQTLFPVKEYKFIWKIYRNYSCLYITYLYNQWILSCHHVGKRQTSLTLRWLLHPKVCNNYFVEHNINYCK
jgi:hypothetical protein